jgi:tetratricopeptide (TPR) repeat protein
MSRVAANLTALTEAGQPPSAELRWQEGQRLFHDQEWLGAKEIFDRLIQDSPTHCSALNYRARALDALNRHAEALEDLECCVALEPRVVHHLRNLGLMLGKLGRLRDALQVYERALSMAPGHGELLANRAYMLLQLGQYDAALDSAHRALLAAPRDPDAARAHALALELMGQDEKALFEMRRVVEADPLRRDVLHDSGRLCMRLGHFKQALSYYERAVALGSTDAVTLYNRCMARLASGDWTQGFREFEIRWSILPPEARKVLSLGRLWLGEESIAGKTLLLHHEQGYGDTLQCVRYAELLIRRGARVIVAVPTALRTLMGSLRGSPEIISEGERVPPHDYLCPLMSLPLALRTTPQCVPAEVPYLRANDRQVLDWSLRLGIRSRFRIGLVWCGRRQAPTNPARDIPLEVLRPLFTLPAEFISLQKEVSGEDRRVLEQEPAVRRIGEALLDFADTAALMEQLDLVITVDSAVAHLAGALGRPVWMLNRFASCWRYGQTGSTSAWYPTMRIFRQPRVGDWASVVRDVSAAWRAMVEPAAAQVHRSTRSVDQILNDAMTAHQQGRMEAAVAGYRSVLQSSPDNAPLIQRLGVAYSQLQRWAEAAEAFQNSIERAPEDAGAHSNLGNVYYEQGCAEKALACYVKAIELQPQFAQAHCNQGIVLQHMGRLTEALAAFDRALACDADYGHAWVARGDTLSELAQYQDSFDSYTRALAIQPDLAEALINRAAVARRLNRYTESVADAERAATLRPNVPEAHCARGVALASLGRHSEALQCYQEAETLRPQYPEALWNRALALLLQGRLREGWPLYESRWRVKNLRLDNRFAPSARWTGQQSVEGKTLLLHAEQGYGDTLQFCRYASLAAERGARVILEAPASLISLLRTLRSVSTVIARGSEEIPFDLQCPLLSLPLAFDTDLATIPATTPYLTADDALRASWRERLGLRSHPRVGIAWNGKPTHTNDARRSIRLKELAPLFQLPIYFVALQKEFRQCDEEFLNGVPQLHTVGQHLTEFGHTAALIAELDLVICVDTAVAHVAGALGKPVWILLPFVADWRWLLERSDSPWYPTATLFRQSHLDDWTDVIAAVATRLHDMSCA